MKSSKSPAATSRKGITRRPPPIEVDCRNGEWKVIEPASPKRKPAAKMAAKSSPAPTKSRAPKGSRVTPSATTPSRAPKGSRVTTSAIPADGINEKAEDRALHIARKIGECAQAAGVEPCDLVWSDFQEYGSVAWGQNSLGIVRRDLTRLGGFNALRDSYFPREATDQAITKGRIRQHANLSRRLGTQVTDEAFQFRQIEAFAERVFKGRIKPVPALRSKIPAAGSPIKRAVVICIGDTHWGSDLLAAETGATNYGKVEEARRTAQVVKQTIEFKAEYRAETELHVVLLGDFLHGVLHDLRDGAVLSEQQSRAIHLLIQVVAHFSAAFPKVWIHAVSGNHDRDQRRHLKKATSGKWDSRGTLIYSAVRMATSNLSNVTWDIPLSAFATFSLFGKSVFVTHGDGVIKVGNPGQSINVAELEKQTNRLNTARRGKDLINVVIVGHVHQSAKILLNNGVTVIVNGAMPPPDPFAVSIGIFESVSSQTIFEAVEGHPVGDSRTIALDEKVDKDKSLDRIVQAWTGF